MPNASNAAAASSDSRRGHSLVPPGGWIIGIREDLLLFLGTPLLLLAVFGIAERLWSVASLSIFTTVLAMGHYLPGLMRAYGDRQLFRRYRLRFLIAPVVLITTAIAMTQRESQAFLIVVVVWGAWHWLMQTYGLVRIYDAKAKNFDSVSARLDYALCIGWFGILYWQTDGASAVFMRYYRAGGQLSPDVVNWIAQAWVAATAVISVLYLVHMLRRFRAGSPPSVLKLALLAVSFFFYAYAFGHSSSKLVAFGLFEGYHDIQYLAIVWVFNRNRVQRDPHVGSFTRYLFRKRGMLIVLYVLLCLGFGSYDFFARSITDTELAKMALGVITGLALVHFYFDGFIWRIRDSSTREALGVEGGAQIVTSWRLPPPIRHALLWTVCAIPVVALGLYESRGGAPDNVAACKSVLALRPDSHKAHYLLGSTLKEAGRNEEAFEHARQARELRPGYDLYNMLYADTLLARKHQLTDDQLDEVIACYEGAAKTRSDVSGLYLNWAKALSLRGRMPQAATRLDIALELDPNDPETHFEYAKLWARHQNFPAAAGHLTTCLQLDPADVDVRSILASVLMAQGRVAEALSEFEQVLQREPEQTRARTNLALVLATAKDPAIRNLKDAQRHADFVAQRDVSDPDTCRDLSRVYAAAGRLDLAATWGTKAAQLYQESGRFKPASNMLGEVKRYQAGNNRAVPAN